MIESIHSNPNSGTHQETLSERYLDRLNGFSGRLDSIVRSIDPTHISSDGETQKIINVLRRSISEIEDKIGILKSVPSGQMDGPIGGKFDLREDFKQVIDKLDLALCAFKDREERLAKDLLKK